MTPSSAGPRTTGCTATTVTTPSTAATETTCWRAVGTTTRFGGAGDDRYDFNNKAVGGGSLGFDTVNEVEQRQAPIRSISSAT